MQTKLTIDLATLAHPVQLVTDDSAVKEFLMSENMLNALRLIEPHNHANIRFVTELAYCSACLDVGHPEPENNGYTLLIVSRALVPLAQAAEIIQEFVDAGKLFGPMTPTVELEEVVQLNAS